MSDGTHNDLVKIMDAANVIIEALTPNIAARAKQEALAAVLARIDEDDSVDPYDSDSVSSGIRSGIQWAREQVVKELEGLETT